MIDPYADRESYRSSVSGDGLSYFRVSIKETDLLIGASCLQSERVSVPASAQALAQAQAQAQALAQQAQQAQMSMQQAQAQQAQMPSQQAPRLAFLEGLALRTVEDVRFAIEKEIMLRPEFQTSLTPLPPRGGDPEPVRHMLQAAQTAGTGPMAAVAGAIAAAVGVALHRHSAEVVVENGGDLFLVGTTPRTIAIAAGKSPFSMKLGLRVDPSQGIGVCTSSGTYGHSLSFGKADAAVVVASDCALADAAATMLGNKCGVYDDLGPAVEWAAALPGVAGSLAVMGDRLAAAGDLELVQLDS